MKNLKIVCAAALLFSALSANAAMVQLVGDDVTFTYDDSTVFGTGYVVGNSLAFSPTGFIAESIGAGIVSTIGTLNIEIEVNAGSDLVITSLGMFEAGDYRLHSASDSVLAEGRLQAKSLTTQCGLFSCEDSDIFSAGALADVDALTEWSANSLVDFSWGGDTKILAQIQNDLVASSPENDGERAFIQKKSVGLGVSVAPEVPVPGAAFLFGSSLLGLVAIKRRK